MIWDLIKNFRHFLSGESAEDVFVDSEETMEGNKDMFDDMVMNGLNLCGRMIPVEILCSILKWVDEDTLLFSCRLVCKEWKQVIDELVWEEKTNSTKMLLGPRSTHQIPWWVSYWVAKENIFQKNLIRNNCGKHKMKHWKITENFGDGWRVEKEPVGTMEPIPRCNEIGNNKTCFTTSFHWCSKEQIIQLNKFGLSNKIMDEIQPDFECIDWITTRFDCGGEYKLHVALCDSNGALLGEPAMKSQRLESGDGWFKVEATLSGPYPPGARYIRFLHKGKDTQFWKGHYGIKITGSSLRPIFPKERFLKDQDIGSSE